MSQDPLQGLIRMANQIAANIAPGSDDAVAVDQVANHLRRFWARSMKARIVAYAEADGSELSEVARRAVAQL